jgi:hypothetical protein
MSEPPYTYCGKRAGLLLAGFAFLLAGVARAQQPTEADSAAVLTLAAERIIMLDSTRMAYDDSVQLRRVVDGPEAAWAAPALERLRTLERPGEELEWLSVSAPQFKGDTALVYEHRRQCRVGRAAHGREYEHRFVRTAEGWKPLLSGLSAIVDEVCIPVRRGP